MQPVIKTAGVDGFLVSFGEVLSDPANRAAIAFRDAIDEWHWEVVEETSTSLVSTYVRFDLLRTDHQEVRDRLEDLVAQQNWFQAPMPGGRRLWRIPAVFGGESGPQLSEVAEAVGLSVSDAIEQLCGTLVRVQTIGFAPGMPYLGELPPHWDIPRQSGLTPKVPAGGVCVAIRQLVLFPVATPTGWRNIGRTAIDLFRPDAEQPFVLRVGDEVRFDQATDFEIDALSDDPTGGATWELIP